MDTVEGQWSTFHLVTAHPDSSNTHYYFFSGVQPSPSSQSVCQQVVPPNKSSYARLR